MQSTSIKIGSRTYSIGVIDNESFDIFLQQKHQIADSSIKSLVDYDDEVILVRDSYSTKMKRELILHEILHACLEDSMFSQDERSEEFISVLTPRLSSLICGQLECVFDDIDKQQNDK